MKRLLSATALTLLIATPGLARENWAILVGASKYDNLDEKYWLKGPPNDVALVEAFLETNDTMRFAPDHVLVLADGLDGATRPTLAAIRAAFAEIAAKAQPGDFVYLHFSGHGSQAPAADASTELDGLDELFLPVDIGPWDDSTGHVDNALVDDEIGAMIDAIRAKGADVWAVFDSCHSGTVTRGAPDGDDEVMMRQLPADALGVPEALMDAAAEQSRGLPDPRERPAPPVDAAEAPEAEGMGSFIAFFAAQTNETTPEKRMPKGAPDRRSQGVFTYTIFETLAERPGITYRQLGQEVLRKYAVKNLTRTTPMFEGDLDRVVFGGEGTGRVRQWVAAVKSDRVTIEAGQLHGVAQGERLAVMASPADATDAALGYLVVTRAGVFEAEAIGDGSIALADIPKGAVLRKVADEVDYTLTVALPDGDSAAAKAMIEAALAIAQDPEMSRRIRFVTPGEEADLRLAVLPDSPRPDAVWILASTGTVALGPDGKVDPQALKQVPSISTGDKTGAELIAVVDDTFTRMARAINLMKIGAAAGGGTLAVKAELRRARFDPATEEVEAGSRGLLDTGNVPRLVPDDVIGARLENTTDGPVDFNVLYVGSDYSVTFMGNGRLQPGDVLDEDYVLVTDAAYGRDRMVIVLSPAGEQDEVEDLSFLEQPALDTERGLLNDLESTLREAGFGETTRAAVSLKKKKAGDDPAKAPMILQFEIDTVPGG
jgi:hypothetical protein